MKSISTTKSLWILILVTLVQYSAGFIASLRHERILDTAVSPCSQLFLSSKDNEVSITYIKKKDMEEILEDLGQDGSGYCVFDVRSQSEIDTTGKLSEHVIACPLSTLKEVHAFELHAEDFEDEFGFSKPHFDETLVFYCASGMRATEAAKLAATDFYPNVLVYKGGANEWFGAPSIDVP